MENVICQLEELKTKYSELEHKTSELEDKNSYLEEKNSELAKLVAYYEECFRLNRHRQFGQSSEKADSDSRQILLVFDEAENEAEVKMPEPSVEEITYTRRRCTGSKEDNFETLPVESIVHSIPEEERICPECGGAMHIMGHEKRRELEIIPAQVKIVEHEREVYSCRRCEHENIKVPVIKAPMPEAPIKGSAASASSIAHIMVQKYMNALPLYRQEMSFLNEGFFLSRQTMANWLIRASSDWLEPLYEQMRQRILQEEILHADETVVQVLKEPGRSSRRESFMWLYRTGRYTKTPAVLYEYRRPGRAPIPKDFLKTSKDTSIQTAIRATRHCRKKFVSAAAGLMREENSTKQWRLPLLKKRQTVSLRKDLISAADYLNWNGNMNISLLKNVIKSELNKASLSQRPSLHGLPLSVRCRNLHLAKPCTTHWNRGHTLRPSILTADLSSPTTERNAV